MPNFRLQYAIRRATHGTMIGHAQRNRPTRRRAAAPAVAQQSDAEIRRQAEIEQDLLLARDIQQGLLLEAVPRLPGWEISAVSLPARDLGGDLYDFLVVSGGQQGIMIGDVSGKGLPAALRMAVARTVFRHEARKGLEPAVTLASVNRTVLADIPQGMVTMLYTTLDLQSGMLRMANAGHNYPIIINGKVSELELSGLPLGVDGDSDYDEVNTCLQHGDTIIFYTDGVVEATDSAGEMYGYERLEAMLQTNAKLKPRAMVAALLHELRGWSGSGQADDITLVVLRRRLTQRGAELRLIAEDVLGAERAAELWAAAELPADTAPLASWSEALPALISAAQSRFGRGLARELSAQLRLALEEYR